MRSFLGNFYRHLAIFFWSRCLPLSPTVQSFCKTEVLFLYFIIFFCHFVSFISSNSFVFSRKLWLTTVQTNIHWQWLWQSSGRLFLGKEIYSSSPNRPSLFFQLSHFERMIVNKAIGRSCSILSTFFKKLTNPGLFFIYFWSFQTNNTIFTANRCEKMSIQYTALGFKPTAFQTWVVTHYN